MEPEDEALPEFDSDKPIVAGFDILGGGPGSGWIWQLALQAENNSLAAFVAQESAIENEPLAWAGEVSTEGRAPESIELALEFGAPNSDFIETHGWEPWEDELIRSSFDEDADTHFVLNLGPGLLQALFLANIPFDSTSLSQFMEAVDATSYDSKRELSLLLPNLSEETLEARALELEAESAASRPTSWISPNPRPAFSWPREGPDQADAVRKYGRHVPPDILTEMTRDDPPDVGPLMSDILASWINSGYSAKVHESRGSMREKGFLYWLFGGRERFAIQFLASSENTADRQMILRLAQLCENVKSSRTIYGPRYAPGDSYKASLATALHKSSEGNL